MGKSLSGAVEEWFVEAAVAVYRDFLCVTSISISARTSISK